MILLRWLSQGIGLLLRGLILFYRLFISPLLGQNCRYDPSCSRYALEAVTRHGPFWGAWLAVRRISRCHPWGGMGYDPVPDDPRHGRGAHGRASPGSVPSDPSSEGARAGSPTEGAGSGIDRARTDPATNQRSGKTD
jgi:putative membrane protein insertion efficiency factor